MKQINRFIFTLVISALSVAALAQWQWLDKDGRKVFSDRAPPAGVPEKNILKQPSRLKPVTAPTVVDTTDTQGVVPAAPASRTPAVANAPKISGVDKELADKKKKTDLAESAKRQAEEDKTKQAKVANCERAKLAKKGFDSGVRMGRVNAKGEREIMDDATRAVEVNHIQSIIDSDCK